MESSSVEQFFLSILLEVPASCHAQLRDFDAAWHAVSSGTLTLKDAAVVRFAGALRRPSLLAIRVRLQHLLIHSKLTCCKLQQLSNFMDSMSLFQKRITATALHAKTLSSGRSQSCAWGGHRMNQFRRTDCCTMVSANHLTSETYLEDMPSHTQGGLGGRKQNFSHCEPSDLDDQPCVTLFESQHNEADVENRSMHEKECQNSSHA